MHKYINEKNIIFHRNIIFLKKPKTPKTPKKSKNRIKTQKTLLTGFNGFNEKTQKPPTLIYIYTITNLNKECFACLVHSLF